LAGFGLIFWRDPIAALLAQAFFVLGGAVLFGLLWKMRSRFSEQRLLKRLGFVSIVLVTLFLLTLPWFFIKPHTPEAKLRVTKREVITMGIGQIVQVNIGLINGGDATATNVTRVERLRFALTPHAGASAPLTEAEDATFQEIFRELKSVRNIGVSIPSGGTVFFTINGPVLDENDFVPKGSPPGSFPRVIRDKAALIVAGAIRYQSRSSGSADKVIEFCFFSLNPSLLILCKDHNVND